MELGDTVQITVEEKLQVCKSTREIASGSLLSALTDLLEEENVSEQDLHRTWLEKMTKNDSIFPEGWYSPPPKGICVLFGTDSDHDRLNYLSLRPQEMWAREDILLDKQAGIVYVYASPVDKKTGIIGDFGMTIYFGENPSIREHLSACYEINWSTGQFVQVGQSLSEVHRFAKERMTEKGLDNDVLSVTDPADTNIGHTIPDSFHAWAQKDQRTFESGQMSEIRKIISAQRRFVSPAEDLKIVDGMSITIEPRPRIRNRPEIPMASYHTICSVYDSQRIEFLDGFEKIFQLVGMDYMLE